MPQVFWHGTLHGNNGYTIHIVIDDMPFLKTGQIRLTFRELLL